MRFYRLKATLFVEMIHDPFSSQSWSLFIEQFNGLLTKTAYDNSTDSAGIVIIPMIQYFDPNFYYLFIQYLIISKPL